MSQIQIDASSTIACAPAGAVQGELMRALPKLRLISMAIESKHAGAWASFLVVEAELVEERLSTPPD